MCAKKRTAKRWLVTLIFITLEICLLFLASRACVTVCRNIFSVEFAQTFSIKICLHLERAAQLLALPLSSTHLLVGTEVGPLA